MILAALGVALSSAVQTSAHRVSHSNLAQSKVKQDCGEQWED